MNLRSNFQVVDFQCYNIWWLLRVIYGFVKGTNYRSSKRALVPSWTCSSGKTKAKPPDSLGQPTEPRIEAKWRSGEPYVFRGHGGVLVEALDGDLLILAARAVHAPEAALPNLACRVEAVRQLLQLLEREQKRGDQAGVFHAAVVAGGLRR